MSQFRENSVTDGRTDRAEFIGPSGSAGGPISVHIGINVHPGIMPES